MSEGITTEEQRVIDASIVLVGARAAYKTEVIESGVASPRATVTLGKAEENHTTAVAALISARAARPEGGA